MMVKHPDIGEYVSMSSQIVHSPAFETAILKIQSRREATLTDEEALAVVRLLKTAAVDTDTMFQNEKDYATQLLKRKKLERELASSFLPTSFLLPASNCVERLVSYAQNICSPGRRSLQPRTLEMLPFLRSNREYRDVTIVSKVVNSPTVAEDEMSDSDDE
ncbi:hypothetical protein AeRB84_013378 [Aphanomyces euteiches]|nr:hypothetical protein AeRB84_013378 [Aphanomyces euteiches]